MSRRTKSLWINLLCIISFIFIGLGQAASDTIVQAKTTKGFIHTSGRKLLDGNNKEFIAKGIAFGNDVWSNPSLPSTTHHTKNSYKELSQMGFNSIRFYLNYGLFEDDSTPYTYKQSGWDWLDKNIAWAKKYNIKLVLNMHFPQGGFQSNGGGMELWTNTENQKRLIALWKEIARRYKSETVIMAFDLLNEPYVAELSTEESTFNQWKNLAGKIVTAIRSVDKNHMVIVERLNASKNLTTGEANWNINRNGDLNFFLIKDKNIAYEFHIYEPMELTHQNASWVASLRGTHSKYPDSNAIKAIGDVKWEGTTYNNPVLSATASGWQYLKGTRFKVDKTSYMFAQPTLQAKNTGIGGSVWFDDIVINEYDENDKFLREINAFQFENNQNWSLWQAANSEGMSTYDSLVGHDNIGSLKMADTTGDANSSNYMNRIRMEQGHSYEISGYARGENLNFSSEVRIRLDFFSCESISIRNKDYLESLVNQYLDFSKENNVPLYLGEFGCITEAFQEGRGGEIWVSDMLDICKDNSINFNYHTYHEEAFGLYLNSSRELPGKLNTLLMEVFKSKLK